jgi:hypothetical protein
MANEAEKEGLKPESIITLPSTFRGSPRAIQQNYQDAIATIRKYDKPDLFITFICNLQWKEIEEQLLSGQTPFDKPELIALIFKQIEWFLNGIFKKNLLRQTTSHVLLTEFQKRDLPRCHMLIVLTNEDKPKDNSSMDHNASTEVLILGISI